MTGIWVQDEGGKERANGRGKRRQTQECSAGCRDKWCRLRGTGVGDVQVDSVMRHERRWGVGMKERLYGGKLLLNPLMGP